MHLALDEQKGFFGDHEPEAFEQVWFDDCVGNPGLIFQTDKNKSFGGAGTLAANDVSSDLNRRTVLGVNEIGRAPNVGEISAQ